MTDGRVVVFKAKGTWRNKKVSGEKIEELREEFIEGYMDDLILITKKVNERFGKGEDFKSASELTISRRDLIKMIFEKTARHMHYKIRDHFRKKAED